MEMTTSETNLENSGYGAIGEKEETRRGTKKSTVENKKGISYYDLVSNNQEFRLFITSYLITNLGEWLTYIASIDFIESELAKTGTVSRTAISTLVTVRLLPNVFLACCGGTLADAHDRRNVMVVLNIGGAACALLFVLAYQVESVFLIYFATFIQQCIAGLYMPSSNSIIPMLVSGDEELKKATTLEGLCWSGMTAFGAAASGIVVDAFGSRTCFLLDGATFLISASILWLLPGDYNVADSEKQEHYESPWEQFKGMTRDGAEYLSSSYFGALVLLKFTSSLAYGPCDVLNVAFSEASGDEDASNAKLGILFSVVGTGCLLGPLLIEPFIDAERPKTVQLAIVVGFVLSFIGYGGWSIQESPFWSISTFALIRAAGSSTIWINSTLLLQKFCSEQVLGRVIAIDYGLALLGEATTAYLCGILMDRAHLMAYQVSFILTISSMLLTLFWGWYHFSGRGAGKYVPETAQNGGKSLTTLEESQLLP